MDSAVNKANEILKTDPNNDLAHYILAQDAMRRKNYDLTLMELQKAIEANKNNYLFFYDMGKIQYLLRRYTDASQSFLRSCELNTQFENSRYNLGLTYVKLSRDADAIDSFKKAIAINEKYEKAYIELGRAYSRIKNYDEAVLSYTKLIEIDPSNVNGLVELGSVYYEIGDNEKAENHYRTAISMLGKSQEATLAKYNLSTILYDEGKYEEALKVAWQAYDEKDFIKQANSKSNIVYNYALILEKNNRIDDAIACYEEVLNLNNNHIKARINLSTLYMSKKDMDPEKVIELLNVAYKAEKDNFEVNNNLGTAYLMKGDYVNAILHYKNALEKNPKDIDVKNNLANTYLKNEEYDNAKVIYLELLNADKKNWECYLNLGKIYMQLKDDQNALKMLLTLQKLNPDYKSAEVNSLIAVITG